MSIQKIPPHNLEAEKAVLGAGLQKNEVMADIIESLTVTDFYHRDNQKIFQVYLQLYKEGKNIDLVTVAEKLPNMAVYLADLPDYCIAPSGVKHYIQIVKEKAIRRAILASGLELQTQAFDDSKSLEELINESGAKILEITNHTTQQRTRTVGDIVPGVLTKLQEKIDNPSLIVGVPSGYEALDRLLGGFQAPDLIILAGRPGMGKTSLALNMALNGIKLQDSPTLFFSLEMSSEQITQKAISIEGRIETSHLRTGWIEEDERQRVYDIAYRIQEMPLLIDDTPALSTLEFRTKCRKAKLEHGIELVIVDYLQLMRPSEQQQSREREIGYISGELKAVAKELNIPIIALSQLNRKVEERKNKRPTLADLRDSGSIEQDADIILFLYNEEYYKKNKQHTDVSVTEVIVAKHRHGARGVAELIFKPEYTAFYDKARED